MLGNLKIDGWAQGIYEISVTRKEIVGSLRVTQLGNKYRYAKAGSGDLAAGKMCAAPVVDTDFYHKAGATHAIGTTEITVTIVATDTAYAEDYFCGGYLLIEDSLVKYPIISSEAVSTTATTVVVQLAEPLHVALSSSRETQLVPSPWMAIIQSAVDEVIPAGVPEVAITAAYYGWVQTGGLGHCLTTGTPTVGTKLIPHTVTGSLITEAQTQDLDAPYCAIAWGSGTDDDAQPVLLLID